MTAQQQAAVPQFAEQEATDRRIHAEHVALREGEEDEKSLRHLVAKIVCAGGYVAQAEGGDVTAERALMRYAAAVTKAIGIALDTSRGTDESHDVTLYDHEAAIGLAGLSALLEAAPRLIDTFDTAGLELRSDGRTCLRGKNDEVEDVESGEQGALS